MSVAIVHDYLTQRGGAERVVLSMVKAFPDAPVYTSVYEPASTFPEFADIDVRPMVLSRVSLLRRDHRRGLPAYPFAFSARKVDADIVLCSSSGFAHGIRTDGFKVVYCYTPPRWLYKEARPYMRQWPAAVVAATYALRPALRRWDRRAAASADCYLTSSTAVRDRIAREYGIESSVVPPGTNLGVDGERLAVPGLEVGFALCVSRMLSYKNVDAVARAFELMPHLQLVIVGDGPAASDVRRAAGRNVRIIPEVTNSELRWLYANCSLLIAASYEDFGLTPVEAATWGRPTAALRSGGFLDTVVEGVTGYFFDEPTPESIARTVERVVGSGLTEGPIIDHASFYTEEAFIARLRAAVSDGQGLVGLPPAVAEEAAR